MESNEWDKVWTEADFEKMGWLDCKIWASGADPDGYRFFLDLDYIFDWFDPKAGETYYQFWISPVTMVFENVSDVKFDIDSDQGLLEIANLAMLDSELTPDGTATRHHYVFDCSGSTLELRASSFKMYVRREPKLCTAQQLTFEERGGIKFGADRI